MHNPSTMEQNNSLHRKGQVTVFMIIGIILLAVFAAILYITSNLRSQDLEADAGELALTTQLRPRITSFVESCLDEVATPGIYLLGIQGGIIYPDDPTKVLVTENALINYGYLNGVNQLERDRMEEQLREFVERNLLQCMNFDTFAAQGIIVTEKKAPKVNVRITADQVLVSLEYKLDVELGEDRLRLESFSSTIPLRLGKLREEAEMLVEQQGARLETPSFPGTYVTVFPFDRETIIYSLSDEALSSSLRNDVSDAGAQQQIVTGAAAEASLVFMFAVRKETNAPPQLAHIPNQVIRSGSLFEYQLTADDPDDDLLEFSSDSALFPVGADGLVQVTPVEAGTFTVTFTVEDTSGESNEQQVRFVVQE